METKWIDNPKKATMNQRLVAGGAGLVAGTAVGYFFFGKNKKSAIVGALVGAALVFGFSFVVSPPKKLIELQK